MNKIDIQQLDGRGSFPGYSAQPDAPPLAAIIVLHEIFGINAGIRRRCDILATAGYLAISPDLFWRIAPGIELDPDILPERERAFEILKQFDQDRAISDIKATIQTAREHLAKNGKVGVVGYCLGGRLAFLAATHTDVDASVGYYGVGIDRLLGKHDAISHPLMLHIAKNDHLVDPATQARMHTVLDGHPQVTLHDYEGVDHGFAAESDQRRSAAAAALADDRTAQFFAQHL